MIGCPKTIDGDLKNEDISAPSGSDTATKTPYSEIIGNIERDASSARSVGTLSRSWAVPLPTWRWNARWRPSPTSA